MAGSLAHIIDANGRFYMDLIENLGDAHEALSECFHLILFLAAGDMAKVSRACEVLRYPDPFEPEVGEPTIPPMQFTAEDWDTDESNDEKAAAMHYEVVRAMQAKSGIPKLELKPSMTDPVLEADVRGYGWNTIEQDNPVLSQRVFAQQLFMTGLLLVEIRNHLCGEPEPAEG